MFIKKLVFILATLGTFSSWAGDEKGNGASFVVCPNGTSVLDFFENRFSEFQWQGSDVELVEHIIKKNYSFSPQIFHKFLQDLQSFYAESKFVSDASIGPIADIGEIKINIPLDCRLSQGVLQKHVVFGTEKRYIINKTHWDNLSNVQKAGAILHELLYRELNSKNSKHLREFNNWLFVTAFTETTAHEYYKQYKNSEFKWTYLYNYPMDAQKIIFDNKPIRSLMSYPDKPFYIFNQVVNSKLHIVDSFTNGKPRSMLFSGIVKFENAQYKIEFCSQKDNCKVTLSPLGHVITLNQASITDKPTGEIQTGRLVKFNDIGEIDEIL